MVNGRPAGVLNGLQKTFTTKDGIFSESEWAQLTVDLTLSPRQAQIVRLLFAGASDNQIAGELDISIPTVRTHLSRLFSRFGVRDRTDVILYVFRHFRLRSHAIRGHLQR